MFLGLLYKAENRTLRIRVPHQKGILARGRSGVVSSTSGGVEAFCFLRPHGSEDGKDSSGTLQIFVLQKIVINFDQSCI